MCLIAQQKATPMLEKKLTKDLLIARKNTKEIQKNFCVENVDAYKELKMYFETDIADARV